MLEKEIALIGPAEVVKPFLVLGVSCHEVQDPEQARGILQELVREQKMGMVFIAEGLAEKLMPEIEKIKANELPAVMILPEYGSNKRLGLARLERVMARAIGKKI